ncbi:MAG: diguanylate cyclase [Sphingorhabdus sp.]
MAFLAFCLVLFLPAAPAMAEIANLIPCVTPVRAGDTLPNLLSHPERFDCHTPQSSMKPGDYWVRMEVPASAHQPDQRPILRLASLWDDGFTLTAIHRDGSMISYKPDVGKKTATMRLGATMTVALEPKRPPITTLIARVNGSMIVRGVLLAPQISTPNESIKYELGMSVLYSGFGGLCLTLLVYNIALWRAMREKFLLAYCAMAVAMVTYAFFTSGAVHYMVDGMSGGDRLRITTPLLAITAGSGLIFMRYFFEASSVPPWLAKTTIAHAAAIAVFGLVYAAVAPHYIGLLDQIYLLGFVPIPFLFCAYLWSAWKQKDPFLHYFLIAWSGPMVSVALRMLHSFGILPYNVLIENSSLVGLAFEALVSSLAIGYRVRLLAQARDRAEIAEANALLMADTDPLTGLLNRRAFLRKILDEQSHWTLVLLDIDHFKRVNDTLGHAGGDDAINSISAVMRQNAPAGALVARMGGEEFAISYRSNIFGLFDPDQLLAEIRTIDLPDGYRITASIGVANRAVYDENDWKILYRAADMALYRAKSNGRDCYVRYSAERAAA